MNKIVLLSTGLILTGVLTACNSTVKPDCWKATHNTVGKDCNSGSGGVSVKSPGIKGKVNKKDVPSKGTTPEDSPSDDTTPDDTTPEDTTQDNNNNNPPNQSNSNDIEGYDPFGGLYGPGT